MAQLLNVKITPELASLFEFEMERDFPGPKETEEALPDGGPVPEEEIDGPSSAQIEEILRAYGIDRPIRTLFLFRLVFFYERKNIKQDNTFVRIRSAQPNLKTSQRLEFLGDRVLDLIAALWLYRNFPKVTEGPLNDMKGAIVKNESMARVASEMGLSKWFRLANGEGERDFVVARLRDKTDAMACVLEALICAVFLDFGFAAATTFVENIIERHFDRHRLIHENTNYKRQLQERIQALYKVPPEYYDYPSSSTVDGGSDFHVGVYLYLGPAPRPTDYLTAISFESFRTQKDLDVYLQKNKGRAFLFLGAAHSSKKHQIAEQAAAQQAIQNLHFLFH